MLSILIPVFNFDVRAFISELSSQAADLDVPCEILCMDDCSHANMAKLNEEIKAMPLVRYEMSDHNLGRSAVRNAMVRMAKYDHLLILDCDGRVVRDDYLKKYTALQNYDVVYGGRVYAETRPDDPELHFHWYCGAAKEEVELEDRLKDAYKAFMTNNFLIKRNVYEAVKMDESVLGYGHEDTLFAIQLKQMGFKIDHIDNPLEHLGLETTDVFLNKSKNAVKNLAQLMRSGKVDQSVKLVGFYYKLRKLGLIAPISYFVFRFEKSIFKNLKGAAPNLALFDLWKLALLNKFLKL